MKWVLFLVMMAGCATSVEIVSTDPAMFPDYPVRRSYVGWREQLYYPETDLRGYIFMEDANVESQPVTLTGHDLATLHLIYAYAWRDVVGGGDAEIAECLSSGIIYVPKNDTAFLEICGGGLSTAGCHFEATEWGMEGLANYIQVVRWDFYKALGNPDIADEYIWIVMHEMTHEVEACLFGAADASHMNTLLWEAVLPQAVEYAKFWMDEE